MKYVAILKTVGDLEKRPSNLKDLPINFPLLTEEFEAERFEDIPQKYDGKIVYFYEDYISIKAKLDEKYDTKIKPKKWFQFWK